MDHTSFPSQADHVQNALDAFWDTIADAHPEAKTGDLSPATTAALEDAANKALDEWVAQNCPSQADFYPVPMPEVFEPTTLGERINRRLDTLRELLSK